MKILLIHYRYFISGGPERYLFNVKKSFEEKGCVVIPFSIKNSKNVASKFEDYFVKNIGNSNEVFIDKYPRTIKTYIDLISREFYSFYVKRKLEELIKKEKPDICYLMVYKRTLSPSVIDACKKYNIPIINRISDYNTVCGCASLYRNGSYCELCLKSDYQCLKNKCVKDSRIYSLMRFLSIKLHKFLKIQDKIDAFVCTNKYMALMMQKYGYPKEKLHVIPTFFKENKKIAKLDKNNIIDKTNIKFLFIGNLDESKGIYDFLDALNILKEKFNKFHAYIVGGLHEEENKKVKDKILEYGLNDFITFVPFVNNGEIFDYYLKTNITVLPTRWVENLPNTLIESIYFNRPVVVPDFGSFKYTTNNDVSFKFKALSSASLSEVLLDICRNPNQILEKSRNCTNYYFENFSEESHIEKLLALMEGVKNENN